MAFKPNHIYEICAGKGHVLTGSRDKDIDVFGWPLFCQPRYYGSKNKMFLKGILVLISSAFFQHLYKCPHTHTLPPFHTSHLLIYSFMNFGFCHPVMYPGKGFCSMSRVSLFFSLSFLLICIVLYGGHGRCFIIASSILL